MAMMRAGRVGVALLALACTGFPLDAQERSGTPLVIDFVALGADGRPADELSPSDLDLRINGKPRVVTAVRRIAAAPSSADTPGGSLPAPYGTSADSASGRAFLLILDEDSFRTGREQPFRNGVIGLLERLGPGDQVSMLGMPYGGVRVPMTNDFTRIRHAIERAAGQRATSETGSQMACRTRLLLESIEGLLRTLSGRTAPLTVVLMTAGLATPRRDAPMAMAPGMCELQAEAFRRVGAAAGAARANFYIAQPDDVSGWGGAGGESISGTGFTGNDSPLAGIEDLSGVTRGVRLPLTAQGGAALARVHDETTAYFVAEVEPTLADYDPRSHRLDLRPTRPGVTVRARPEMTFTRSTRPAATATRITVTDMLLTASAFPDLPLRAAAFTLGPAGDGDGVAVALLAEPSDRRVTLSSAGAALVDPEGRVVARWSATDAGEEPLMGVVEVPPGSYRLRVAAVDTTGRGGAADYRFDAGLQPVGSLRLGGLVLGLSRDGVMVPRLEFSDEPAALASFEIAGAGESVTAALEIAPAAGAAPVAIVPLAIEPSGPGRFVALATVPLGALAPGDYLVRGIVTLKNGQVGRTERALRKIRP